MWKHTLTHTKGRNHNSTHTESLLNVLTAAVCVCECVCVLEVCAEFRAFNLIPFFIDHKQQGQLGNTQYRVCVCVCVRVFVADEEVKDLSFQRGVEQEEEGEDRGALV